MNKSVLNHLRKLSQLSLLPTNQTPKIMTEKRVKIEKIKAIDLENSYFLLFLSERVTLLVSFT
jgi:hypothetical protein